MWLQLQLYAVICGLHIGCVLRVYSYNKSCQELYGKANLNWS